GSPALRQGCSGGPGPPPPRPAPRATAPGACPPAPAPPAIEPPAIAPPAIGPPAIGPPAIGRPAIGRPAIGRPGKTAAAPGGPGRICGTASPAWRVCFWIFLLRLPPLSGASAQITSSSAPRQRPVN